MNSTTSPSRNGIDLKNKPVIVGLITAMITAFVTTSFNDYLSFREQDAIHQIRLEQIKNTMESYGSDIRREMGQIRVLISTNDTFYMGRLIALSEHKDNVIERLSRIETIISEFQTKGCSTWTPATSKTILVAD